MKRLALALALLGWGLPATARANPWDLYGFNARALGMGSAQTASSDDFTAVYYNPASLTAAKEPGFGFGLMMSVPVLGYQFDKPDSDNAALSPPDSHGISFGALFPLGGESFRNRAAFGIAIHVPTSSLLDGEAIDPAIPQWYMYQSLPRRIVAALGLGISPIDILSLGAGIQILAGVTGQLDYELDVVSGRFTKKTVTFDIVPQVAPLFGLELRPLEGLRIGASYRAAIGSPVELPVNLAITGIADLEVTTSFQVQYTPHQFSLGVSYELAELELLVSGDITWALWSGAPDPSVDSRLDVGGDLFVGTGLDMALDVPPPGQTVSVDLGFRNTVVPRLGVEKRLGMFSLRGGYALRPSPAPSQTGATNYVDTTSHELSVGAGVRVSDPFGALANPFSLDLGGAWFVFPGRRYEKVDPSEAVGSYRASGSVFVLGVSLRYAFGEGPSSADASGSGSGSGSEELAH